MDVGGGDCLIAVYVGDVGKGGRDTYSSDRKDGKDCGKQNPTDCWPDPEPSCHADTSIYLAARYFWECFLQLGAGLSIQLKPRLP